jgi:hypothetical protein
VPLAGDNVSVPTYSELTPQFVKVNFRSNKEEFLCEKEKERARVRESEKAEEKKKKQRGGKKLKIFHWVYMWHRVEKKV